MMLDFSTFERRSRMVQAKLLQTKTDCMLVIPSSYMKYTTGYSIKGDERFFTAIFSAEREPFIFANLLYEQQVSDTPVKDTVYWRDGEDAPRMLIAALAERGIPLKTIAVDPNCPAKFVLPLMQMLSNTKWLNAANYIDDMRLCKDDSERRLLGQSCKRADEALWNTMADGRAWIGKTEEELLARLVYEMTKLGIKNGAACVCVGKNAAVPHHHPDNTKIQEGSCLLVDFGGDYENYNTDMTRNFYFGEPPSDYQKVYNIVLNALQKGKEAAKIGNRMQDVDRAVRGYISGQGYGDCFIHRTGHGIGIDCHEGASAMEGDLTVITENMTFSCEPGIYLPGRFGVRIEDELLITLSGAKALHSYPLELQVLKAVQETDENREVPHDSI